MNVYWMIPTSLRALFALTAMCLLHGSACGQVQQPTAPNPEMYTIPSTLRLMETIPIHLGSVGGILGQVRCDSDGNVYIQPELTPPLRISKNGDGVASFSIRDNRDPSLHELRYTSILDIAPAPDGHVYALIAGAEGAYEIVFTNSGKYDSVIRLDAPKWFHPISLAVFDNSNTLVAGQVKAEPGKAWRPFTAIFDHDGKVIANLSFKSDTALDRIARESSSDGPLVAINTGAIVTLSDGNAYLIRGTPNPIVYVLGAGGYLLRTLHVRSPAGFEPTQMASAGDALLFKYQRREGRNVSIVFTINNTLDGGRVGMYVPGEDLRAPFVCYEHGDFVFLGKDDGKLALLIGRP